MRTPLPILTCALAAMYRPAMLLVASVLAATAPSLVRAQNSTPTATLTNITQFSSVDGISPQAAVIQGADGAFYGVTQSGGAYNNGTIFRRAADGTITVLHSFNDGNDNTNTRDGRSVIASLVQGPDGAFYGVAQSGGTGNGGTVFKLAADGTTFTILRNFDYSPEGYAPAAALYYNAQDGLLYGTTRYGPNNSGAIFSISTDGATFNLLHQFNQNTEGTNSYTPLIQDANGVFYGALSDQGASGTGALFTFTVANNTATFTILHSFGNEGANASYYPFGRIILDNGVLYGTTRDSNNGYGTVYALTLNPGGTAAYNVLHFFPDDGTDGLSVQNGLTLLGGKLYGEATNGGTNGNGTIFSLGEDGSAFTVLHLFAPATDGYNVNFSNLTVGTDGNLYGVAPNGGHSGYGTLFQISPAGTFTVLNDFVIDHQDPEAALVQGTNGAFYGTTQSGGAFNDGRIFRVDASGAITTLHEFSGTVGATITTGSLNQSRTTAAAKSARKSQAKVNRSRTLRTAGTQPDVVTPVTSDGANPVGALIQGANGIFYGTTQNGGDNNNGMVFSISADGTAYTVLHNFAAYTSNTNNVNADGSNPVGALVVGQDGKLYGVTNNGGASGYGVVYRLALDGSGFALVQTFTGGQANPAYPGSGLTVGPDGSFYGASEGGGPYGNGDGIVYKISPDGATLTLLHAFTGAAPEGYRSNGVPVFGADGYLYGATYDGGNFNDGTLYKVSPDGATYTTLYNFSNGDGNQPHSALLASTDGYLYGTTTRGGIYGQGVIYRLSTSGDLSVVYNFSLNGGVEGDVVTSPASAHSTTAAITTPPAATDRANGSTAELIQGADGFFYGTSSSGGTSGNGSVYRVNVTPVITSASGAVAKVGVAFSFAVTAAHHSTSFAASGVPAGLTIDTATGLITGAPTAAGTYPVILTVANDAGTASQKLTIVVQPAPGTVTSAAPPSGQIGVAYNYQITGSNNPTSFGATGLPAGLTIDPTIGLVSGTPTVAGTFPVTFSATNAGGTSSASFSLTIAPAVIAPVITSAAGATVVAGQPFNYQITANNNPTSFGATGLPAGLTVNAMTGLIFGSPTTVGTYPIVLSATNASGTGAATLTLTVTATTSAAPVISSAVSTSGQVGQVFDYQVAASNTPASFGAAGLPAGLTINATTGLISGTPTAAGTFPVALSSTNASGTGTASLSLTITAAALQVPVVSSATSASGQVAVAFSYQIAASNSPIVYGATGLPGGLVLNDRTGVISGTPTAAGTFSVTIMATNSAGSGTQTLTVTIAAQPLPVIDIVASVPQVTLGTGQLARFAITRTGGDSTQLLYVNYRVSGSARAGVDYEPLGGMRKFKPGKTTVLLSITPEGTLDGAAKRTIKLTLLPGDGYTLGTATMAKVKFLAAQ